MLLASPQAGVRPLFRDVMGDTADGAFIFLTIRETTKVASIGALIVTTSGGRANDCKTPAAIAPLAELEGAKLRGGPEVSRPSPDQRCSILPLAGSRVAMALLPPTNSLK